MWPAPHQLAFHRASGGITLRCRSSINLVEFSPNLVEIGPELGNSDPLLEVGRFRAKFCRYWGNAVAGIDRIRPDSADVGPMLVILGPSLAEFGQCRGPANRSKAAHHIDRFGPSSPSTLGQIWLSFEARPVCAQSRPTSALIWPNLDGFDHILPDLGKSRTRREQSDE